MQWPLEGLQLTVKMKRIWVITPNFEQRDKLLPLFVQFLAGVRDLQVIGHGNNGITISAPKNFEVPEIRAKLPKKYAQDCFVDEAEAPVLMGNLRPKIRR